MIPSIYLIYCLLVFYLLQMVSLYRDPKGEKIFEGTESQTQTYHTKSLSTTLTTTIDIANDSVKIDHSMTKL